MVISLHSYLSASAPGYQGRAGAAYTRHVGRIPWESGEKRPPGSRRRLLVKLSDSTAMCYKDRKQVKKELFFLRFCLVK